MISKDLQLGRFGRYVVLAGVGGVLVILVGGLLVFLGLKSPSTDGECDGAAYQLRAKPDGSVGTAFLDITAKKADQEWFVLIRADGRRVLEYSRVTDAKRNLSVTAPLPKRTKKMVVSATFASTGSKPCNAELTVN